jgi:hypothetical protein
MEHTDSSWNPYFDSEDDEEKTSFRSQDPLDLAALASCRLLVNDDFVWVLHFPASRDCSYALDQLCAEKRS